MSSPNTVVLVRNSARFATFIFSNPPANVAQTVARLVGVVGEFELRMGEHIGIANQQATS